MIQLYFPGMSPPRQFFIKDYRCGENEGLDGELRGNDKESIIQSMCDYEGRARFIAVYLRFGSPITREEAIEAGRLELEGFDSIFNDSGIVFACGPKHLAEYIMFLKRDFGFPDIISAGANAIFVPEVHTRVMRIVNPSYSEDLTQKVYSGNRESLIELWDREKFQLGF